MLQRHWAWFAAAVLLIVLMTEVVLSTRQTSASWDEGDHIFSGYMNWKNGEYSLNPEHPPLLKLVAALPLLPLDLKIAPRRGRYFKDEAYYGGRELLFRNDPQYGGHYSADSLLFRVHMAASVFALALACLMFVAGREMFGAGAGLIAMSLFVFDPTVLTNAPFVTTDTAAACLFFASIYTFYRYVKQPSLPRICWCGLTIGAALVAKHSTVLLLPVLLLLAGGELAGRFYQTRRKTGTGFWKGTARLGATMLFMAAIAIFVLWGVYGFRYAMRPVGVTMPPLAEEASGLSPVMSKTILFFAQHRLLPESYLFGLVDVQNVGMWMPSYIFGKIYAHGQWFYFPVALSLKWSIGALGLLALAIYAFSTGHVHKPREVYFLALPGLFYLAVAMAGPLNIGVRHVLPVFPFAFALAGGGGYWLIRRKRIWLYPVCALLLWHTMDSLRMYPNYMPYANALWGGPSKTHLYLTDSATDWGQELKWTRQYLDAHNVHECWFAYFPAPFLLPSDYGIPCKLLPTADTSGQLEIAVPPVIHGPVLVSYADLNGFEYGSRVLNPYQSFFERQPDAVIANGIAVYHGDYAVPSLAAMLPLAKAQQLLGKGDAAGAVLEAQSALAIDPQNYEAQIVAGNALHLLGRDAEARPHYNAALTLVQTMEPSAQAERKPSLESKIAQLKD